MSYWFWDLIVARSQKSLKMVIKGWRDREPVVIGDWKKELCADSWIWLVGVSSFKRFYIRTLIHILNEYWSLSSAKLEHLNSYEIADPFLL